LVDELATHAEACKGILDTLTKADDGDVVVISFVGHGSPDGSLVFAARALPLSILKVRLMRSRCLELMSVGVTSAVDLNSLSAEGLMECRGKVTALLLRPHLGADPTS
jgi:hypothetical protein